MAKHRRPSFWQTHRLAIRLATAGCVGAVTVTGTLVAMAAEPAPLATSSASSAVPDPVHPVGREAIAAFGLAATPLQQQARAGASSAATVTEAVPTRTVLAEVAETERLKAEQEAEEQAKERAERKKKARKRAALARESKAAARSSGRLSADAQSVLAVAERLEGSSYARGGDGPSSFDCSGFTQYVFSKVGVSLPHSSSAQRGVARRISASEVRPGDLVFVYNGGGGSIGHVAIYGGRGVWYEAQGYGRPVGRHGAWSSNVSYGRVL